MKYITPFFLAFWMLMGGAMFFTPWVYTAWLICSSILVGWALLDLSRGVRPLQLVPPLLLVLAGVLSTLANLDILPYAAGMLLIQIGAMACLVVVSARPDRELGDSIYLACWIALALSSIPGLLMGGAENRNIAGIWPALLVMLLVMRKARWYLYLPPVAALVIFGSRGALFGLAVGLLVYFKPNRKLLAYAVLALGIAVSLSVAIRPQNAANRVGYWIDALGAGVDHNPLFGLGPGGIFARRAVLEPGKDPLQLNSYQPHAHNLVINVWAENGMLGFLMLFAGVMFLFNRRDQLEWSAWPWALIVVFLAESMVDFALFYPGPILVFMFLLGSLKKKGTQNGLQTVETQGIRNPEIGLRGA